MWLATTSPNGPVSTGPVLSGPFGEVVANHIVPKKADLARSAS